jgi:hypothetical protein
MNSRRVLRFFSAFYFLYQVPTIAQEHPHFGLSIAKSNNVLVGAEFNGNDAKRGGGGTILSPLGIIATLKSFVGGTTDGNIQLASGEQIDVKRVIESNIDLAFIVTARQLKSEVITLRKNSSLREGEELVCRAPIGGKPPMGTARGILSHLPSPNPGMVGVQLPLTTGCVGVGIFDLKGSLVGVTIGSVDKAPGFYRAWAGDVIRGKIVECFGTSWDDYLPGLETVDLTITTDQSGMYGLRVHDKIKSINGVIVNSMTDWLLAGGALSVRDEKEVTFEIERNGVVEKIVVKRL